MAEVGQDCETGGEQVALTGRMRLPWSRLFREGLLELLPNTQYRRTDLGDRKVFLLIVVGWKDLRLVEDKALEEAKEKISC